MAGLLGPLRKAPILIAIIVLDHEYHRPSRREGSGPGKVRLCRVIQAVAWISGGSCFSGT
jgi:hypothetical protein